MSFESEQLQRLKVCRYKLMKDQAFYAILLQSLDLKIDTRCPTAYTDGRSIGFSAEFAKTLSDDNITFVLTHEVDHVTRSHLLRGKARNAVHHTYNAAADYCINYGLKKAGIGEIPEGGLYDEKYDTDWTTDMIYDDLMNMDEEDRNKKIGKPGDGDAGFDSHESWEDENGNPLTEGEIMSRVISAAQAADAIEKASGQNSSIPDHIRAMIDDYLAPQIDWREEVNLTVSEYSKQNKSWERLHRRYMYEKAYFPYYAKGEKAKFAIFLDQSGSVSDEENHVAISEVYGAISQLDDYELWVGDFSTEVHQCRKFTPDVQFDYVSKGTGGTALSCITDYLCKEEIEVDCLFVITDGYTSCWPDPDYCEDQTYLCTSDVIAPHGKTLPLKV